MGAISRDPGPWSVQRLSVVGVGKLQYDERIRDSSHAIVRHTNVSMNELDDDLPMEHGIYLLRLVRNLRGPVD